MMMRMTKTIMIVVTLKGYLKNSLREVTSWQRETILLQNLLSPFDALVRRESSVLIIRRIRLNKN